MAKRRQKSPRGRTAGRSPSAQLDLAMEAAMAGSATSRLDAGLAALLQVAGDLRGLPRPQFKARLKADLNRSIRQKHKDAAPPRRHGVATPYLMIRDAARALDFYKTAFGATELMRMADPGGHIAHAEIKVGDAPIMIADEDPANFNLSPQSLGGSSAFIHVYVDDVDAFARQAERGGARVLEAPEDYPYGDRRGKFADPFGHVWMVATHQRDVTAEQMKADWDRSVAAEQIAQPEPKPAGYHSITPYLQVTGAAEFIDFLKRAFDAEQIMRVDNPDGTIAHAQMQVAGSMVELADASDQFKPNPTAIWLFVEDTDATYARALKAGATSMHPPMDQEYGNREASVTDPFGNHWYIAAPLEKTEPWPAELRTVTPYLHPKGTDKLIDFLKEAFAAQEVARHADDKGIVQHAQIKIGDSILAMGEAHGPYQPMPPALHLYVPDTDAIYRSALRAGATSLYAPRDEAYGDRSGGVTDPFGNVWYIATHKNPASSSAVEARTTTEPMPPITPFVYVESAEAAAEFYKNVFEASELFREIDSDGKVSHIRISIGPTELMLCGVHASHYQDSISRGFVRTPGQLGGTALHLYVHVPNADAAFQRALAAGAKLVNPIRDESWGDRCGGIQDPFGHIWYIATPLKEIRH